MVHNCGSNIVSTEVYDGRVRRQSLKVSRLCAFMSLLLESWLWRFRYVVCQGGVRHEIHEYGHEHEV